MAPKKKDKPKAVEWLQCSLCSKLILPLDAELHSKGCENVFPHISNKILTGNLIKAEDVMDGDKKSITKTVRDEDSVVWLTVPAMTVCQIAIGQLVVINGKTVKRAWPLTSGQTLTNVCVSKQTMEELCVKCNQLVSVERLWRKNDIINSVVLKLRDVNEIFEQEEFQSYVSSYLDGVYLTQGTQLRIKYFGQVCYCSVIDINLSLHSSFDEDDKFNHYCLSASFTSDQPAVCSFISKPDQVNEISVETDNSTTNVFSPMHNETKSKDDLSSSFSNLSIDKSKNNITSTPKSSTPRTQAKQDYPSLGTPVADSKISNSEQTCWASKHGSVNSSQAFGKILSGFSKISIIPSGVDIISSSQLNWKSHVDITLQDVGGLDCKVEELKRRIHQAQLPSSTSRCILIHGPSGTGKTLLVRAVLNSLNVNAVYINGTDIWSKLFGQAEANLKNIFKTAADRSPSVIVIDDMDIICPKRTQQLAGQQDHRIVGTLLSLVDSTAIQSCLVVIGITNKPDSLDPAVRRSGRFGCELEIGVPNPSQREEILNVMLSRIPHYLDSAQVKAAAMKAHGYVGADLTALLNEASVNALSRLNIDEDVEMDDGMVMLTAEDFMVAGHKVKPSALREVQLEVPQVRWSDIGGMNEVKMRLKEAVELPLSHPTLYKNLGIEPPRGLLMYGPPGCSKTMIARAVATECRLNFLAVKGPELFNQYVGESEKAIREVFRKARSAAPSVIFFDEIDAISAKRGSGSGSGGVDDRVLTQLLTEMDGLEYLKDVFIMAATNRPDKIDRALLRPGRFDSLVYVPLPDDETRKEILETKLSKMKVATNVSVQVLVEWTLDYSGAEVIQLCQEAALTALREDIQTNQVQLHHFEIASKKVLPQTDMELLQIYQKFSTAR